MIYLKSNPINLLWYESNIIFVIVDNVLNGLKELELGYTGDEINWDGCTTTEPDEQGNFYCIVCRDSNKLIVLHEAHHAINKVRNYVISEVNLEYDETYVREVSWIQNICLEMWESYFNDLALKENENSGN